MMYDPKLIPIDSFSGEYRFLSNFYPCSITILGVTFSSSEHAFQAMKATSLRAALLVNGTHLETDDRMPDGIRIAHDPITAGQAKKAGRLIEKRKDWDNVRIDVMEFCLRMKFKDTTLLAKLLDTGKRQLIEGNNWGDTTWGVCDGKGDNYLGRLLMYIRAESRIL